MIHVGGVPDWVPAGQLLGPAFRREEGGWMAELPRSAEADVAARLRGISLGGGPLAVTVDPPLPRALVRAARERDARARRDTTPGFSRSGVRLDDEGRWSLTPEELALALGKEAGGQPVIDATAGCGGNAIGFARAGCAVTAIDRDPVRLALARHNAALYGVSIRFLVGDAATLIPTMPPALVFVDPPWGRDWSKAGSGLEQLPLLPALLPLCRAGWWAKVPPSFDPAELLGCTPIAWFGTAAGDVHRVKFLVLKCDAAAAL